MWKKSQTKLLFFSLPKHKLREQGRRITQRDGGATGGRKATSWGGKPLFAHKRARQPTWSGATTKCNKEPKEKTKSIKDRKETKQRHKSRWNHNVRWKNHGFKKVQGNKWQRTSWGGKEFVGAKKADSKQTHALSEAGEGLNRSSSYFSV